MKFSDNGINVLKQLEGCVKIANKHIIYDDKDGKPVNINKPLPAGATIGYGHLIKSGEDFKNGITETEATDLLRKDIVITERAIQKNITSPLTQNQYDALVIFVFNIGVNNFAKSSVVKYINNPKFYSPIYKNLESAWKAWDKTNGIVSAGLISRRNQEWNLFTHGCIW